MGMRPRRPRVHFPIDTRVPSPLRTRRLLAVSLVLGLCTTVGVAWLAAGTRDMISRPNAEMIATRPSEVASGPDAIFVQEFRVAGAVAWSTSYWRGVNDTRTLGPIEVPGWARPSVLPAGDPREEWPGFAPPRTPYSVEVRNFRAYGWPLPALAMGVSLREPVVGGYSWESRGVLTVPWLFGPDVMVPRQRLALPCRPLWIGLTGNSILAAGVYVACFCATRGIVRARRRERSECAWCRYDLQATPAEAPCPECGHGRHERV